MKEFEFTYTLWISGEDENDAYNTLQTSLDEGNHTPELLDANCWDCTGEVHNSTIIGDNLIIS